jgi:hypothetical protein
MMLIGVSTARHCGCRILHEVSMGTVMLRIHAGAIQERPSRDEPVQFMLTGPDVDVLIDHLNEIRRQLSEQSGATS